MAPPLPAPEEPPLAAVATREVSTNVVRPKGVASERSEARQVEKLVMKPVEQLKPSAQVAGQAPADVKSARHVEIPAKTQREARRQEELRRDPPLVGQEAKAEATRPDVAKQALSKLDAKQEEARQELAWDEAVKQDTARQQAADVEATRLEAVKQDQARRDAARVEVAREEAAQQELAGREAAKREEARLDAARQEAARQEASRQEMARQEAARQETARQEAARQEAARQETARQETARQETARQEAARQEAARQEAARQELAKKEQALAERAAQEAAREDRLRQIGKQLDLERAQRENTVDRQADAPLPTASSLRRRWLFGRADPDRDLVLYADAMSRKIELNTTIDTLREVLKQPHTQPMVTIAVRADGSVEKVTFEVSSGVPALDDAIRNIITSRAPYGAFSPSLAHRYDVIEIRRTWVFDYAIHLQ